MKEYLAKLKVKSMAQLGRIIRGVDKRETVAKLESDIFDMFDPRKFDGKNGMEVHHIKGFEESCILINQYIPKDPKTMTTLEFYQALEHIKKVLKRQNKKHGKSNLR